MKILYVNPVVRVSTPRHSIPDLLAELLPQHDFEVFDSSGNQEIEGFERSCAAADVVVYELGFRAEYAGTFHLLARVPGVVLVVDEVPVSPGATLESTSGSAPLSLTESQLTDHLAWLARSPSGRPNGMDESQQIRQRVITDAVLATITRRATAVIGMTPRPLTWLPNSWALEVLDQWLPSSEVANALTPDRQFENGRVVFIHHELEHMPASAPVCWQDEAGAQSCILAPDRVDEFGQIMHSVMGAELAIFSRLPQSFEVTQVITELESSGTRCLILPDTRAPQVYRSGADAWAMALVHAKAAAVAAHWAAGVRGRPWIEQQFSSHLPVIARGTWADGVATVLRSSLGQPVAREALDGVRLSLTGAAPSAQALAIELLSGMFEWTRT